MPNRAAKRRKQLRRKIHIALKRRKRELKKLRKEVSDG